MKATILLDSNVVVAALAEAHEHHDASLAILNSSPKTALAVSSHSYAEAYSTLTRTGRSAPFGFRPEEAWAGLETVRAATELVGLSPAQTFEAVRDYASIGGVGPRLYDKLIGQAAAFHGMKVIATWNVAHMRSLFPAIRVLTPVELTADQT